MADYSSGVQVVFGDETVDTSFAEFLDTNHMRLPVCEPQETGGSGGKLVSAYLEDLADRQKSGRRIIKLVAPTPDAAPEPRNHKDALSNGLPDTAEFIKRHLVELAERAWKLGDSWVMFQHPAGDGEHETETLVAAGRPAWLPRLAGNIVSGVLDEWNPDPKMETMPATAFVEHQLGSRLDATTRMNVWDWILAELGPQAATLEWFTPGSGEPALPNPVFLKAGCILGRNDVQYVARGRAHGDLHPGNIMVPVGGDDSEETYTLIDLSRFSPKALLARDPVHLLLCLIADSFLAHMSDEARDELITGLIDRKCAGPLIPQGLAELVDKVGGATIAWGASRHLHTHWLNQWYLALQACALMFIPRKGYTDRDRWWFFRLAAHACWAYLDRMKAERPAQAPVLSPKPQPQPQPQNTHAVPPQAPPAKQKPVPATAPEVPAEDPVLPLLKEIYDTFDRRSRELAGQSSHTVKGDTVEFVKQRAIRHWSELRSKRPAAEATRGRVDEVVRQLLNVTNLAGDLQHGLQQMRHGAIPPARVKEPLQDLVRALDTLLIAAREASMAVSGQPS